MYICILYMCRVNENALLHTAHVLVNQNVVGVQGILPHEILKSGAQMVDSEA